MIHQFVDDHRPHPRPGIRRAERPLLLRHKMHRAHTIDVASERHPVLRGAKLHPLQIPGKFARAVRRE
jgi:hypothetical protein